MPLHAVSRRRSSQPAAMARSRAAVSGSRERNDSIASSASSTSSGVPKTVTVEMNDRNGVAVTQAQRYGDLASIAVVRGVVARLTGIGDKFLFEVGEGGVAAGVDLSPQPLQEMRPPFAEIDDAWRHAPGCSAIRSTLTGGVVREASTPSRNAPSIPFAEIMFQCRSTAIAGLGS